MIVQLVGHYYALVHQSYPTNSFRANVENSEKSCEPKTTGFDSLFLVTYGRSPCKE